MSGAARTTDRVNVGGLPITGNGFGGGFHACAMPVSLEEGSYPGVIRRFVASEDARMGRVLDKAEDAGRVATGYRRVISRLYPNNKELHVKREGKVVYVYKMRLEDER